MQQQQHEGDGAEGSPLPTTPPLRKERSLKSTAWRLTPGSNVCIRNPCTFAHWSLYTQTHFLIHECRFLGEANRAICVFKRAL